MLYIVKLLMAITGLVLPGYLIAKVLGIRHRWVVAFPFSALLLVEMVIFMAIFNIKLSFNLILVLMVALSFVFSLLLFTRKIPTVKEAPDDESELENKLLKYLTVGFVTLLSMAVLYRAISYPLSGYDTYFRWEGLARLMLNYKTLAFYPPVTPDDFTLYLVPDGIAPLIASLYWWLYAAIGQPVMQVTSVSVILQLISAMALTYYGARYAFGQRAAYFSLAAFASSSMLINGIAIGQETGFTAMSVAGQFCFAWAAVQKPSSRLVVAAALFAVLGALARDYGLALSLSGFLVLALHSHTRRFVVLFTLVTLLLSAPWYLRNWILAGNPLYPHAIPGGFNTNKMFLTMQNSLHVEFSFYHYSFSEWLSLLGELWTGAPIAISGGLLCIVLRCRKSIPFFVLAGVMTFLWLLSMGETAGGAIYSMRVLTPAFIALSVLAGKTADYLFTTYRSSLNWLQRATLVLLVTCSLYSLASALSHPFLPRYFFSAISYSYAGPLELDEYSPQVADRLEASDLKPTGVLTSNPYLGTNLQRRTTRFKPVMVWNPGVKFIFDNSLEPLEIQRRLIAKNIRLVSLTNQDIYARFFEKIPYYRWLRGENSSVRLPLFSLPGFEEQYFLLSEDAPEVPSVLNGSTM